MFAPANQSAFTLTLDGVASDLKVYSFKGQETLSQPYCFDLEVVGEQPDLDLESLMHREAFLGFAPQGHGIHGLVYLAAQGDAGRRLTRYQLRLVPQLAYLQHSSHQRIFQGKTVPQIISLVLEGQGCQGDTFEFRLSGKYPEREYCVQFDETDLAFVQRLCAEVGIHYHFQHSPDRHLLVFGDDQTVFAQAEQATPYHPGSGMVADTPAIKRFTVRVQARTTAVSLRDYDFSKPNVTLESAVAGEQFPRLEEQRYPGRFSDRSHGKYLAQRALERHRCDHRLAHGSSDQSAMLCGQFLRLAGHPREEWNDLWLVTAVTHEGLQPQVLEDSVTQVPGAEFRQGYRNDFVAAPWDVTFRPPLPQARTLVAGYQNAVVTGPGGSEVHCDALGRVKVQMAWDRAGQHDEHSSCWLRVASGWAHQRYGSMLIPRVGMEVLVGFVNGDVDMPMVMGCVPNAVTPVPLTLPADKTRSIFRSQSSPGGGGYNELCIEDRKGAEEIYLRAERDWRQQVLHDFRLQAGQDMAFNAGPRVTVDAAGSITLQAGGHSITVSAAGIFSSAPIQLSAAPASVPAVPPVLLGMAQVLNFKRSAPFCAECERCKNGVCTTTHGGAL